MTKTLYKTQQLFVCSILFGLSESSKITLTTVIPCTGMQALKPKYLEIGAALNTLFGYFWITVLIPHLKPETFI